MNLVRVRILALLSVLLIVSGCALEPPTGEGVWLYQGSQQGQLKRYAGKALQKDLLSAQILDAIVRVDKMSAIVVKFPGSAEELSAFWQTTNADGGEKKVEAKVTPLEKDSGAFRLVFAEIPPDGLFLVRIKGGTLSGWYPVVLRDSADWAFQEGRSWFALNKYDRAEAAFKRSVEQEKKAEPMRLLGATLIVEKKYKEALSVAEDARSLADKAAMNPVLFATLVGEARMMTGDYKGGIQEFEHLQDDYPGDKRHGEILGRLLAGVDPAPSVLVEQIYTAAAREGADGVEPFIHEADLESKGAEALRSFARGLLKFGRVKKIDIIKEQRFGRVAFVMYQIRYSDGTKLERKLTCCLDDKGRYRVRID